MNSDSLRGEAMANIKSKLKLTKDKILGENHKNVADFRYQTGNSFPGLT
jgi:hypothetical protein